MTSIEAEKRLIESGFEMIRSKGGHRIYHNGKDRFILPFHKGKILHPKIVKNLLELLEKN
jgi:predicted RNA binding protein YcfA (HicA-like mRNA interferase family)